MSRSWLISINKQNFKTSQKIGKYGCRRQLNRIRLGDFLIFYIIRSWKIKAICKVESDWKKETTILWIDEKKSGRVLYPYRVKIEPIAIGEVKFKEIAEKLEFVKNRNFIELYLRRTPANFGKPIPQKDFELILEELKKTA